MALAKIRSEKERNSHKAWLAANRERVLATRRAWCAANREKLKAQARARYAANPEKFRALTRAQHAAHPERRREAAKLYKAEHEEERKAYLRDYHSKNAAKKIRATAAWQRANPERSRLQKTRSLHLRRARLLASASPGVTAAEWLAMVERFGGCCAYCGNPGTTIDHVIPISKGGRDEIGNVLPACRTCNASKGNKDLTVWLARKGLADPRAHHSDSLRL